MESEAQKFQTWLQGLVGRAKDGDRAAFDTLWVMFNSLARSLARLSKLDRSVDADLFEGVLKYCHIVLIRGLSEGDSRALIYCRAFALGLCESIEKARGHKSGFVAKMEATVRDWPVVRSPHGSTKRPAQLAKLIFDRIRLYRRLLSRKKKGIESRDRLTRDTEQYVRVDEGANLFPEVLRLPKKLDAVTCPAWWKVGKKILKQYWENDLEERARDWATLGADPPGNKKPQTYAIMQVQKAFVRLANSQK